jgi:hypothetical protein
MVAPEAQDRLPAFLGVLDDFAAAKMRNAVPGQELRRAEREIDRYRRLVHATHAAAAKAPPPRLIF